MQKMQRCKINNTKKALKPDTDSDLCVIKKRNCNNKLQKKRIEKFSRKKLKIAKGKA